MMCRLERQNAKLLMCSLFPEEMSLNEDYKQE